MRMKMVFFLFLFAFLTSSCTTYPSYPKLLRIAQSGHGEYSIDIDDMRNCFSSMPRVGGKWEYAFGYAFDNWGRYNFVKYYGGHIRSNDVILVKRGTWKYMFFDGRTLRPPLQEEFDDARCFSHGRAAVRRGNKWGFIDEKGNPVVDYKFDAARDFEYADLAAVKSAGKWGLIGKAGKFVVEPQFINEPKSSMDYYTYTFSDGRASVRYDNKYVFRSPDGNPVSEHRFDDARHFSADLAAVKSGGKWGFIDKTGNLIIGHKFDDAGNFDFSEGLAAVKYGGKWGLINKMGNPVIGYRFDEARAFAEGLWAVKSGGKWGFVDKTGKVAIDFKFQNTTGFGPFVCGHAGAQYGDKWGVINKTGKFVIEAKYDRLRKIYKKPEGLSDCFTEVGIVDKQREEIRHFEIDMTGRVVKQLGRGKLD